MISAIFLITADTFRKEPVEEAPELLEREGVVYSLRGGPRTPQPTKDKVWDPVAVYAPDELSEEEALMDIYLRALGMRPDFDDSATEKSAAE